MLKQNFEGRQRTRKEVFLGSKEAREFRPLLLQTLGTLVDAAKTLVPEFLPRVVVTASEDLAKEADMPGMGALEAMKLLQKAAEKAYEETKDEERLRIMEQLLAAFDEARKDLEKRAA